MHFKFLLLLTLSLLSAITSSQLVGQRNDLATQPKLEVIDSPTLISEEEQSVEELADEFEALKTQIENIQLSETQQKAVKTILVKIESNLKRGADSRQRAQVNRRLVDSAGKRAEANREWLKQLADLNPKIIPAETELGAAQRATKEQMTEAQEELKTLQAAIIGRRESAMSTPQTIENLRSQLNELETKLTELAPLSENAVVSEIRRLELRSTMQCIEAEIERLNSDTALFNAEEKAGYLISANEYWTAKEKRLQERFDFIQAEIEKQRRSETQQSVKQAQADVGSVPIVLKEFAEENARIAELATSILRPLKNSQAELKAEQLKYEKLQKQYDATENRVKAVGLTASVGAYLRNRKSEIPREGWLRPILVDRLSEIERYQSQQFDLQEAEQSLIRDDIIKQTITDPRVSKLTKEELKQLELETDKQVSRRRDFLAQAITNHKDYLAALTQLQNTETKLGNLATRFHEYINERILWIRSNDFLFATIQQDKSEAELSDSQNWILAKQKLLKDVRQHWVIYLFTAFAFCLLFYFRMPMRAAIGRNSETVARGINTDFWPTLQTTFFTIAVALPLPLLLGVVGWRMTNIADPTTLNVAVGRSLVSAGWVFFLGETLRQICRKQGLAASHFGWTASTLNKLNSELAWFVPFGAVAAFLCSLLYLIDVHHETDTIERICFILAVAAFATFLYRIFHFQHGIFREQIANNPKSWIVESRGIILWLVMAIPCALIMMIVIGYYYSAIQMLSRIFSTIVALVGLEVLRSLVLKFIQLSRRKAHIAQSRARLSAQSSRDENVEPTTATTEIERAADLDTFLASENEALDENFERSRKLIAAGIAASWVLAVLIIWADVFPALKGLDRYVFWTTTVERVVSDKPAGYELALQPAAPTDTPASEPFASANDVADRNQPTDGKIASQPSDAATGSTLVNQSVTLRNFMIAVFILSVAIFAVKNLPAFIELVFLKHLPIEQSMRHAIRAITGYVILMVGVFAAGRAMYIGWNQIQWLATALTFGLAFGLQEIFANFIAGIILLLERPLRIGDIVQVDDVSGVVSKIRIRATTIRNFDQKEFVIPNKEFITGRLLNWTLADKTIRQTIRVGIAYGSDVRTAKDIMRRICESHPEVLAEPKTIITFEEFGDSSLNLSARIYLRDFDSWWAAMDSINLAIDDEFKSAGIEISFPQRDLHIRTAGPEFENSIARTLFRSKNENRSQPNGIQSNDNVNTDHQQPGAS